MVKIYRENLVICNGPFTRLVSNMSLSDRFKKCLKDSSRGDVEIICKKTTSLVFKHKCNYVTEILTGIKIPIMLDGYGSKYSFGKIDKPYCIKASVKYTKFTKLLSTYGEVIPEQLKRYIELHRDEDGTFITYKKELESLLEKAEMNFKAVPVEQYKKPETVYGVYREFQRTRKR